MGKVFCTGREARISFMGLARCGEVEGTACVMQ